MEKKKPNSVPGTVISSQNGHLLVSTGIASLDSLLGGGLPVGTVVLVEEDIRGIYSKVLLKYFLAEGLMSNHSILLCSQDIDPTAIIYELPAVIDTDPEPESQQSTTNNLRSFDKDLKIAFRYQNITSPIETQNIKNFNHNYDLSKKISDKNIEDSDIQYWTGQRKEKTLNSFVNPKYNDLLKTIKDKIKDENYFLKDSPEQKTILRIGIHSLGSPMWLTSSKNLTDSAKDNNKDLQKFFFCLRALVRSARAVVVITIPSFLYDEVYQNTLERCIHSSDIAMKFQSFSGTELESNQILQDFHGFFYITKLAAMNSLVSKHPGAVEYVYKLRMKKFCIKLLHLPPDIGEDSENNNRSSPFNCSSTGGKQHLLDF